MKTCHGCGIEKDPDLNEVYPYYEEDGMIDDPISPLFWIDVQPANDFHGTWKRATVCHQCFHKLQPDMWISDIIWQSIQPKIAFNDLPNLSEIKET